MTGCYKNIGQRLMIYLTMFLIIGGAGSLLAQNTDDPCDLSGMTTFTQGGWGSGASGNNPGSIRDAHFDEVFPQDMVITGGQYTLKFTSSAAVENYLPAGGPSKAMTGNLTNPTNKKAAGGILGGQITALTLNVEFDRAGKIGTGAYELAELVITGGPFQGMTVDEFLDLAQTALTGGNTQGFSYSEFNDAATALNENFDNGTVNHGYVTCPPTITGSLGDKVWLDVNGNGVQDNGETGVSNVTVKLYLDGALFETTTTNQNGIYLFDDLNGDDYEVEFVLPAGYEFSPQNQGNNDNLDSDANTTTGKTGTITLANGDHRTDVDAGLVLLKASLGNYVWLDEDHDGVQDGNEAGVEGITVKLLNSGGSEISSTTTNEDGLYSFTDLNPGAYSVQFVKPSGYSFSPKDSGNDLVDSDADLTTGKTAQVTLAAGDNNTSLDAGIYDIKGSIGDYVWNDTDNDGVQDLGETGIEGVTVTLYKCNDTQAASTTTDADGKYLFDELLPDDYYVKFTLPNGFMFSPKDAGSNDAKDSDANTTTGKTECITLGAAENNLTLDAGMFEPKASLGDFVWIDLDEDGVQDNGEPVMANVPVSLYTCDGNFITQTNTDQYGKYLFGGLDPGDYKVKFTKPNGYYYTVKDAGADDALDSDADPVTGFTACVTLAALEENTSVDAGFYQPTASIGNFVWEDTDKDGVQDNGEPGFEGALVKLYNCGDDLLATTITNENGFYLFSNYPAGDYYVRFILPNGYEFSPKDAGADDAKDSDADQTTGKTDCFSLAAGDNDDSRDAGIYPTPVTVDIEITKTASEMNPDDGDPLSFTITAKNNGPANAASVEVKDLLPDGFDLSGTTTSQGTFDNVSGIWTVGALNSGQTATLTVNGEVNLGSSAPFELYEAEGFNLFVLENLIQPSADTEGKVAVGGNASLNNYSVGDLLQPSGGTVDVLIVGGHLEYGSGSVEAGNIVYGQSTNLPKPQVSIPDGTLRQDTVIDFEAAENNLKALAASLSGYAVNGTTTLQWSAVNLNGTNPLMNVFDVDGADLTASTEMNISVPNGSVVIVNISGDDIDWSGGLVVAGTAITNVIYNVYEATNLKISSIDVTGTLLAPYADLDFPTGVINGQVIVKSMTGTGQFNNKLFAGNVPVDPNLVNCAELFSSDPVDSDESNNCDCVTVVVGDTTGGGGSGSGGTTNFEWELAGGTGLEEMIWTIGNDGAGNMLCGTVGGNIYRSENNGVDWTLINSSMQVGWVWSLVTDGNGRIYAGTENGIYYTDNNGTDWNGPVLEGYDVRALVIDGFDNLYAGTWGAGIFKSVNGTQWEAANSGLTTLAVHALAVSSNSKIYAGTFGGGVYESADLGATWEQTGGSYSYVWALDITSNDVLYAGTYGGGVYTSENGGANWQLLGGASPYVYSITVDAADNVFITTWADGVFMLNLNGPASPSTGNGKYGSDEVATAGWMPMGLNEAGISSVAVNPQNTELFAGSEDGNIYKLTLNTITGVEDITEDNVIPEEFELSQNYPNPFNPSTTINFSVREAGNYKLTVYNIIGQEVATLVDESLTAGKYNVTFDAAEFSSGIYIYRLSGQNVNMVKKMILMK